MYVLCRFLQPGHTGGKPNAGRSRPLDNIGLWCSESWKTPHEGLMKFPENFVEKHVDVFMQNKGNVSMSLTGGVISKQRWRYSFAERIFNTRCASIFFFFLVYFSFFFSPIPCLASPDGQREFCKSGLRGSGLRRFTRALAAWSWLLSFFKFSRFFFFFSVVYSFSCTAWLLNYHRRHYTSLSSDTTFCRTAALDENSPRWIYPVSMYYAVFGLGR